MLEYHASNVLHVARGNSQPAPRVPFLSKWAVFDGHYHFEWRNSFYLPHVPTCQTARPYKNKSTFLVSFFRRVTHAKPNLRFGLSYLVSPMVSAAMAELPLTKDDNLLNFSLHGPRGKLNPLPPSFGWFVYRANYSVYPVQNAPPAEYFLTASRREKGRTCPLYQI